MELPARNHRTLVIFDQRAVDGSGVERMNRLVASLNGPNIKADLVAVRDPEAPILAAVPKEGPAATHASSDAITLDPVLEAERLAAEAGYTLAVVVRQVGSS